jgi:putative oxidoreductase
MENLDPAEFDLLLFIFRVLFGLTFAAHGYVKMFRGGKLAGTAGWFDSIGMRPGKVHALAASFTEMGTGLLLVVGLLTPLAAAGVIGVMVVAGWTVHRPSGFFIVNGGWEYTFIVGLVAFVVAGLGPGQWSLDAALGLDDTLVGYTGMAIALIVGVAAGIGQVVTFYRPPEPDPGSSSPAAKAA